MNPNIFHITLYALASMGTLLPGLTLALLLGFAKRAGQAANLFLSLALVAIVLKTGGLTPFFLPALGPLLYFYVRQLTYPDRRFRRKDLLHFCSLLVGYWMPAWLVLFSVIIYLYLSHRLIQDFYRRLRPVLMDRPRFVFRRLDRALLLLGLFCGLSLFSNTFYLAIAFVLIGMAAEAMLKPDSGIQLAMPITDRSDAKEKGRRLKEAVAANRFYEDAELTLTTLAVKLMIHPHDLSRIINVGLEKNFSDFINEFRVREVARKMQDQANDRLTLLGIAYESGFNSKRTFNRVFKEITGKTPVEYKNSLRKEGPIDKLAPLSRMRPVILRPESPMVWASEKLNRNFMFRNYVKIAYRSLKKNKGFTSINILGLSVGLATCLLIVFYVVDELSYDRYNVNADRIYRVNEDVKFGGNTYAYSSCPAPLALSLKNDYPIIENTVRFKKSEEHFRVKKGDENLRENKIVYADSTLFEIFTLPMIEGSPSTALVEPHTVVITEGTAKKYFNRTNVVGQILVLNDTINYKITGVIKDIPRQSHFNFDFFLSMSSLPESRETSWLGGGFVSYIVFKPGTNYSNFERNFPNIINKYIAPQLQSSLHTSIGDFEKGGSYIKFTLSPLISIHLRSDRVGELGQNSNIQYVYIFSAIAIFILLIASINFMNLSTARSSNRAREVGVRKVLGSSRKQLIAQFLAESILVTFVSTLIALLLSYLLLPFFNEMAGKELSFSIHSLIWLIPLSIMLALVIGFLAGFYPAFFLSAFKPVQVLKGKLSAGFKGGGLRSLLVVFQFSISIFLIIGTVVIYDQLHYIQTKSLGYDRDQVLIIQNASALGNQAKIFKQDLTQLPGVVNTTMTGYVPTAEDRNSYSLFPDAGFDLKKAILTQYWPVDQDYIKTLGIKVISGRNFSNRFPTDSSALVVNESFAKLLGVKDPLNKKIYKNNVNNPYHIIGIIKDFNFNSFREKITPLVLFYAEDRGAISLKIHTANLPAIISQINHKWKSMAPGQPFSYSFMDKDFDATYRSDQRVGTLFISFSTLAILIACLGLFGLAAYAAEQRNKEIGIRKVLGASVSGIVSMLSMDFIKLVFIAIAIATPVAWFAMNKWLQDFAYRIDISWWIVAAAGLTALFIAFITISFQSIRAAIANPVDSLRSE